MEVKWNTTKVVKIQSIVTNDRNLTNKQNN